MAPRHDPENADRRVRSPAAVAVLAALAIMFAAPSEAQWRSTPQRSPNVTIDYGVLDSLGPAPTVPRLLLPSLPRPRYPVGSVVTRRLPSGRAAVADQRIVLTPPGRAKASRVTKRSRPARRAIAKSKRIAQSRPGKRQRLVPEPAPAKKPAVPGTRPRKLAAMSPIPPPPISSTPLEPSASVPRSTPSPPPAPEIRDRPRPPPTAITPSPPPAITRAPAAPRSVPAPPSQTAALTPVPDQFGVGRAYRLMFASKVSKLDAASIERLDEIAAGAKTDRSIRLKLLSYAGATGQTASQSRRLSLSRALAVRSYLIDKGVRSVQFEVRAKGKNLEGGPPDRVDVLVTKR